MQIKKIVAFVAVGCTSVPLTAGAAVQVTQTFSDRPACAACRIDRRLLATLNAPYDSVTLGTHSRAAMDSRGRLYVSPNEHDRIFVYDTSGKYLRTVGRRGAGPGEFRDVHKLAIGPRGDSLFAFETNRRFHVFSPEGQHVRSGMTTVRVDDVALLADGRMVVASDVQTRSLAGLPLHILDPNGERQVSFGAVTPIVDPDDSFHNLRRIAGLTEDGVWAGWVSRYQLELWPLGAAVPRKVLARSPGYTPAIAEVKRSGLRYDCSDDGKSFIVRFRPMSITTTFAKGGDGRLWMTYQEATNAWRSPLPGECRTNGIGETIAYLTPSHFRALFEVVVNILDPASGSLVAMRSFPGLVHQLLRNDLYLELSENKDGVVFYQLWKLTLTGR